MEEFIELLRQQNLHVREELFQSTGNVKDKHAELLNANKRKVVDAVKTYLRTYPVLFSEDVREALCKVENRSGRNTEIITYEPNRRNSYRSLNALAVPYQGELKTNEFFINDPEIGYVPLKAALEEAFRLREIDENSKVVFTTPFQTSKKTLVFRSGICVDGITKRSLVYHLSTIKMYAWFQEQLNKRGMEVISLGKDKSCKKPGN